MQAITQDDSRFPGTITTSHPPSRRALLTGRLITCLAAAFLIFDSSGKLLEVQPVVTGTKQLGYAPDIVFPLGVTLLSCVLLYLVPRTSVLGALLLTGYLGGAVATHVRVGSPWFTHVLFPVYLASLLWGGLMLRDARLRTFLPSLNRRPGTSTGS
jgi:hypothetical protein